MEESKQKEELSQIKTKIKTLVIGESGSGKTHFSGTFPKSYWICTEPGSLDTLDSNPKLLANVVKHEYYIPNPIEELKDLFIRINNAVIEAHKMYANGEIETLVLDNATYLMENRWMFVNQYQRIVSSNTGEEDTRGMYRKLSDWAYPFFLKSFTSFPGNVVVTSHVRQESDEAMKKKKIGQDFDIVPDILGGFRNQIPGLFSLVMFLNKIESKDGYRYIARTDKGKGQQAKNRYNLGDKVENISYDTIVNAILTAKQKGEDEQKTAN